MSKIVEKTLLEKGISSGWYLTASLRRFSIHIATYGKGYCTILASNHPEPEYTNVILFSTDSSTMYEVDTKIKWIKATGEASAFLLGD